MISKSVSIPTRRRGPMSPSSEETIGGKGMRSNQPTINSTSSNEFPCVCGQIFMDKKSHTLHVMSHRFNQDEYGARIFKPGTNESTTNTTTHSPCETETKVKMEGTVPIKTKVKLEGTVRIKQENLETQHSDKDIKPKLCENVDPKYFNILGTKKPRNEYAITSVAGGQTLTEAKVKTNNAFPQCSVKREVEEEDRCFLRPKRIKLEKDDKNEMLSTNRGEAE